MKRDDLDAHVFIVAQFAAGWTPRNDLCRKVRSLVGSNRSIRLIAAATIFHIWLLKGKPDRGTWQYSRRVRHGIETVYAFESFREDIPPRPEEGRPSTTFLN